jgi:hypothetical protein
MAMMRTVKLELARSHEFPEGSPLHGYELHLPIGSDGKIDHGSWPRHKYDSDFRRFWGGEEERGRIKHGSGGWKLSFTGNEPEELIFRADGHRFITGEYVSITERDGVIRTFRVVSVH